MAKPQYSGPWQRIRRTILERDAHTCQINGPTCTRTATQVDHITPVTNGGAWYDPTNLRAACSNCNLQRNATTQNDKWRTAKTRIVLVTGPPFAGKTRWVNDNKGAGDLVIDYGELAASLGGNHEAASAARGALLRQVRQGKVTAGRTWIVSANPEAETMFPHHRVVTIDPGRDEVERRMTDANANHDQRRLVGQWYAHRSASTSNENCSRKW